MKENIRRRTLEEMRKLSASYKETADRELTQAFLSLPAYQEARVIASYLSMKHEFDTSAFIEQALSDGKVVLVPKTFAKGKMVFVPYDKEDLVRTSFGLLEPRGTNAFSKEEIDLIHVPGLVFNQKGYRIGYGGGYYDRYLADFTGQTVSTIYPLQRRKFQAENHDISVKEVIEYEKDN